MKNRLNKYRVISFLIVVLFILPSCNDFLNVRPKGYTIPSKYDDYWQMMNYAQMYKAAENYPAFITDDALLADGDLTANFTYSTDEIKNLYTFKEGDVFGGGQSDPYWDYSYNRIYVCNTVINNVIKSEGSTEEKKLKLQAEAKVARAFEYLNLIALYAVAYDETTAATDYGVPLMYKEEVSSSLDYKRNTVKEVYEAIKKDLDESIPYLAEKAEHTFRASKSVAYGFLARMYLMQRKYDLALENAVSALKIYNSVIDLNEYIVKPYSYIGKVVKKEDGTTSYPEGKDNIENIYARYAPYVFGNVLQVYASEDLLSIFAKDLKDGSIDKRHELYFSKDEFVFDNFEGYTIYCPWTYVNLGLNTPEIILTAAECYARKGSADDLLKAEKLYNEFRDKRIENNIHITFKGKIDAITKILDERRREFALVGAYRLTDLKRLNKEQEFEKTITHVVEGTTYTLPPNDIRYVMPLPPVVKSLRPDLPDYKR